jgi:putative nucleotidyltransferase with HDIG domain
MLDRNSLVQRAYDLEPLPANLSRLAGLMAQDLPDLDEISEVLSFDPVAVAKILRVANSAFSASRRAVTRVRDAVGRLGPGLVFSVAIGSRTRPMMQQAIPGYDLSPGELWNHSVLAALAAEAACSVCSESIPPAAFAAALLHDLGKLVLSRFLTPGDRELLRRAAEEAGTDPADAESEILSLHHGEIGAAIAQHWQFPDCIVRGIHYHHHPRQGGQVICHVTYLADVAAKRVASPEPLPARELRHLDATMSALGITPDGFARLCDKVARNFEKLSARYA